MTNIRIITLDQTASTNSYLAALPIDNEADITVVRACHQTAGRGQGNNVWESEANKNLLFSFNIKTPKVPANQQFLLSMTCALAVKKALEAYIGDITLKWPNDIYKGDGKLGGILIETTIGQQGIKRCIFGVGIKGIFTAMHPIPFRFFNSRGTRLSRNSCSMRYWKLSHIIIRCYLRVRITLSIRNIRRLFIGAKVFFLIATVKEHLWQNLSAWKQTDTFCCATHKVRHAAMPLKKWHLCCLRPTLLPFRTHKNKTPKI